jgi:hypothetical protein
VEPADYVEIAQLCARYCHIVDEAAWDRLDEVFAADGSMTVVGFWDTHRGMPALHELYSVTMNHPIAHHSTSLVVLECTGDAAKVVSKWVTVRAGGQAGTGVYADDLVRTPQGWRIRDRVATPGGGRAEVPAAGAQS